MISYKGESSMATVKCQVCGAPMDGATCGYCGFNTGSAQQQQTQTAQAQPAQVHTQSHAQAQPQFVQAGPQVTEVHHVYHNAPRVSTRNKGVALLLCFFVGVFGAHQFYAGKVGMGILYFFTVGLFGFGVIVDFIKILLGSFRDVEGNFIK